MFVRLSATKLVENIHGMKKIIVLSILFYLLGSCDISPRNADAYNEELGFPVSNLPYGAVRRDIRFVSGIEYHIYNCGTGSNSGSVFVVNHTKEKEETELIHLQLLAERNKWSRK